MIAAAQCALHLFTLAPNGLFRDELYYLACANHLNWGYVDQPPLSIAVLWLTRGLFGDSPAAIRFPALLATAAVVWLTALLTREMGGGRTAQRFAAIASALAPVVLAEGTFFSMNPFELCWRAAIFWLTARLLRTGRQSLWLRMGVLIGVAGQAKLTGAVFALALCDAVLCSPSRSQLRRRWP